MMFITPYHRYSRGVRVLKKELRTLGIKAPIIQGDNIAPSRTLPTLIVNWGKSKAPTIVGRNVVTINSNQVIQPMLNKRSFFERVGHGNEVPTWTTDPGVARMWQKTTVARTILTGHSGDGIILYDPSDVTQSLPEAPLYTMYTPKTHEYRVHVGRSLTTPVYSVLMSQRKIFKKDIIAGKDAPTNWKIRNVANGFIYARTTEEEPLPGLVAHLALTFMLKYFRDIHFCALDILYHEKKKMAVVLEGNTAPGLTDLSAPVYARYLQGLHTELYRTTTR